MKLKPVMVNLDAQIHQIAAYKLAECGSNVSEFCRICLERFVTEDIKLENPARLAALKVTESLIEDLKTQFDETQKRIETELKEKEVMIQNAEKTKAAIRSVIEKYPRFERKLPENDPYGDYTEQLDLILAEMRSVSGCNISLQDIRAVLKEQKTGNMSPLSGNQTQINEVAVVESLSRGGKKP